MDSVLLFVNVVTNLDKVFYQTKSRYCVIAGSHNNLLKIIISKFYL